MLAESVFYQVLNAVKLTVCLKKMFNGEIGNASFKKETEKIVSLQVTGLIQIIVKSTTEKNFCSFLSSTKSKVK